jgi:hypothetical protein
MRLRDRLLLSWYVLRLRLLLDGRVPHRAMLRLLGELRTNTGPAAPQRRPATVASVGSQRTAVGGSRVAQAAGRAVSRWFCRARRVSRTSARSTC